jgi:membrane-associated phospholipid phosphatase
MVTSSLFEYSLGLIERLQKAGRGPLLTIASKLVSMFMGGEVMMVLVFISAFALAKPSRSLYYLLMMIVNVYFTVVLKLILHGPRPYMVVEEQIKVVSSSSEFGDPSGHTMSCAQVLSTMFLDYVAEYP